jgi:hypothetical protein
MAGHLLECMSKLRFGMLKKGHLFYTLHGHKTAQQLVQYFSPKGDFFRNRWSDCYGLENFDENIHQDIIVGRA